jgi:hypothetical protein
VAAFPPIEPVLLFLYLSLVFEFFVLLKLIVPNKLQRWLTCPYFMGGLSRPVANEASDKANFPATRILLCITFLFIT